MSDSPAFSLDQIRIASPCPVKWSDMMGDDTKRYCRHCNLHVYNLTNMTRADAEALVLGADGRLCAQVRRRADGTLITKDCPVGALGARRRLARMAAAIGAVASLAAGVFGSWALGEARWQSTRTRLSTIEPFRSVRSWVISTPSQASQFLGGALLLPDPIPGVYAPTTSRTNNGGATSTTTQAQQTK